MIWEWIIKAVILVLVMTAGFAYVTLYERKVLARMQVRIGPNRAGPWGILQPVADGIKLIFKEELIPAGAEKIMFVLAPIITVIPALIVTAVIPWGGTVNLFGREVALHLADVNVGTLYIMAVTSISVYGITLAGWSSNNKYALLGGLRATAQMISYELALGLSFVGPIILAGSMSIGDIVEAQRGAWFALLQPVAFAIYFMASVAEINRAPFDMPEAEQELTAGYHVEYSGMKFALFFMAEYIKMIAVAMIGSSLFLGGYRGPFVDQVPWLGPIYLFIKVAIWLFVLIWIRATMPRIRYDKLMALGWKVMFPLALLSVLVTAIVVVLIA
ncbi:MAG TPA: NADH-quinone oxidoreductase subunit NuoH [Anaerolineaceae bacterium]|jgi:NADH-quinone oxidoreductase subunit H|nr:NADH-quinone oxidoreductase subunit NuoH [Anaerolineaceae bacterium]NMD31867.1 NADH-quinone oxidoreductase subunit NuoH [Chloroflexota bacterium]HOU44560.1 NADH-quinone oxidoreductase subunit NuoH [Anaerolineaceae bacterium]HPA32708.1 NADH-quinone oxidoreductase subunit NuoH [Anaerolineaceae bacterium]HQF45329.1 NADH-quinone oxidoreductase subunit NuoH [Anaerolineaceae bacterium]